ncbi:DUF3558 family protein [Amycolatopsis sp. cg13]|uniref:DUF3558 family protein n=1 Tax=Amycolatopsis sp. cg13 TaxID=3238807 RepID=UPI0035233EFC
MGFSDFCHGNLGDQAVPGPAIVQQVQQEPGTSSWCGGSFTVQKTLQEHNQNSDDAQQITAHRMRARFASLTAAAVAGVVFVAGCSGSSAANSASGPASDRASSSSAGKALPYAGAPKVENPLPASVLSGHPCDSAFAPGQVGHILGEEPQGRHADNGSLGAQCHWVNSESGAALTVLYVTEASDGLSAVYANSKQQSTVWRPLSTVRELPAVAHSAYGPKGDKSFCQVSVGINDQHDVDVSVTLSPAKVGAVDPCGVTAQIAGMVVTNLAQRAGK